MKLALISDVFYRAVDQSRLDTILADARAQGADLALLPELPLNRWAPASKESRDEDAEGLEGPRYKLLQEAARKHQIALVGGAIVRVEGKRENRALIFDSEGNLAGSYAKVHLPEEPGFWETSHYEAGTGVPAVFDFLEIPFGVQICSDNNRPQGSHSLAARGAGLILVPRATEAATYQRWQLVFRANALVCSAYVASVNRPEAEAGVEIGGPSIVVSPQGEVLLETTDPLALIDLDPEPIQQARQGYPGYLPWPRKTYSDWWQ